MGLHEGLGRRTAPALFAVLALALLAACGDEAAAPSLNAGSDTGFPSGPAVLVQPGYEPPGDRVPSTGAYLPANGKPTLVYVDAIW